MNWALVENKALNQMYSEMPYSQHYLYHPYKHISENESVQI